MSKTIVFVTHDFDEAVRLGDRIAVLSERSQIEQFDTPANILANPANDYVSQFVGHGAALKRLGLIPVHQARLGPNVAIRGAIEVSVNDSLRDALDSLVLSGGTPVAVVNEQGRVVGSIDIEKISAVLGAEIPAAPGGGALDGGPSDGGALTSGARTSGASTSGAFTSGARP